MGETKHRRHWCLISPVGETVVLMIGSVGTLKAVDEEFAAAFSKQHTLCTHYATDGGVDESVRHSVADICRGCIIIFFQTLDFSQPEKHDAHVRHYQECIHEERTPATMWLGAFVASSFPLIKAYRTSFFE